MDRKNVPGAQTLEVSLLEARTCSVSKRRLVNSQMTKEETNEYTSAPPKIKTSHVVVNTPPKLFFISIVRLEVGGGRTASVSALDAAEACYDRVDTLWPKQIQPTVFFTEKQPKIVGIVECNSLYTYAMEWLNGLHHRTSLYRVGLALQEMGDHSDAIYLRFVAFHTSSFFDWVAVVVEIRQFECSEVPPAATVNKLIRVPYKKCTQNESGCIAYIDYFLVNLFNLALPFSCGLWQCLHPPTTLGIRKKIPGTIYIRFTYT